MKKISFRRRMKEELKIQEIELQMKSVKRYKTVNEERVNVTKLSLDWFRFYSQFESEIAKS